MRHLCHHSGGDSNPANQTDTEDIDVWTGALTAGFNLTSTFNIEGGVFMVNASGKTTAFLAGAPSALMQM